jgi:subtilisin family serine protease
VDNARLPRRCPGLSLGKIRVSPSFRTAVLAASVVVACGLAAFVPVTAAPAAGPRAARAATPRPLPPPTDRFIVAFKPDAPERRDATARQRLLDAIGRRLGVRVEHGRTLASGAELVRTGRKLDAHAAKKLVLELRRDPRVAYVEPDRLHRPLFSPDDPLFPQQTYLMKAPGGIGLDLAWNRGQGAGVVVAVLDSGITAHPDLDGNVLTGGYDFISDPVVANDGNGRDADPADSGDWTTGEFCPGFQTSAASTWHGTAVAGVIAAVTDNATGVAGAAPAAKILPVRVLGKCGGYTSDVADAIVWAAGGAVGGVPANTHPAEVINLSLGSEGACGATLQAAVNAANAAGALVVAASGDGMFTNADNLAPGNCTGVVSVGSTATYARYQDSAFGTTPDVLAPTTGPLPFSGGYATIQVPTNTGTTTPAEPTYGVGHGTSISAALVSGTLAVMQGIRPQTPAAAAALLRATAMDEVRYPGCPVENCAKGLIDADAATLALRTPTLVFGGFQDKNEGAAGTQTPVDFVVRLTAPVTTPVTFTARTIDGTAIGGTDFVALPPTTYTIAPGQTSKTVTVLLQGDDVPEVRWKSFEVRIENAVGAALVTYPAFVQLKDDDGDPDNWLDPTRTDVYVYDGWPEDAVGYQFFFEPPAGATDVTVKLTEAFDGDPDLYVRKGALPTPTEHDCAAEGPELDETCALGSVSGLHYIKVVLNGAYQTRVEVSWHQPTQLSIDDVQVEEGHSGTKYLTFKVVRTPVSQSAVTFSAAVAAGTATAGTDFILPAFAPTQTLYPEQASRDFKVQIVGDTTLEPNETLSLALSNVVGATVVGGQAVGTILNDEGPTLSVEDVGIVEGNAGTKSATVDVVLSQPAASPVTFSLATANGTATAGSDYTATTWTAQTIAAGQVRKSLTFPVLGDTAIEYDESVRVALSSASVSILRGAATVMLTNDDGPVLGIGDVTIGEGNGGTKVATFTVQLSTPSLHPVGYTVRTVAGTATANGDFGQQTVTGVIPAGMLAQTFQVAIYGDTAVEANETFQVVMSDPVNATLGDAVAVGTITNDDDGGVPTLSIADVAITEGNSGTKGLRFTMRLSHAALGPVTYTVGTANGTALAGSDYVARSAGGQVIPAGSLTNVFDIVLNGDTTPEASETFLLNLSGVTGATVVDAQAVGTITNDDGPALSIGDVAITEGNSGTKGLRFTVSLAQASASPVTYAIATADGTALAGTDYVARSATSQVIPAGALAKTFDVVLNGDTAIEPTETFKVNVTGVVGAVVADAQAIGTITNDDGPSVSIGDVAILEGNSGTHVLRYTVSLSQASASPVTYTVATANGTALAGSDYVARSLANQSIPAGMLSKVFDVTINGDATIEPSETVQANLTNVVGGVVTDAQAIGTITNDDGPTLSVADVATVEGASGTRVLRFTVSLSQAAAGTVTFNIATANGTALAGSDYVARSLANQAIAAGGLTRVFDVTINGDTAVEANETFLVNLTASTGASILDGQATGTITNDD